MAKIGFSLIPNSQIKLNLFESLIQIVVDVLAFVWFEEVPHKWCNEISSEDATLVGLLSYLEEVSLSCLLVSTSLSLSTFPLGENVMDRDRTTHSLIHSHFIKAALIHSKLREGNIYCTWSRRQRKGKNSFFKIQLTLMHTICHLSLSHFLTFSLTHTNSPYHPLFFPHSFL